MTKTGRTILLLLFLLSINIYSDIAVMLTVDDNGPAVNDVIKITLEVKSDRSVNFEVSGLKDSKDLQFLPGTQTYSRTNIINFNAEYVRGTVYRARVLREGSFRLGPAVVRIDKKLHESNTIVMRAGKKKKNETSDSEDRSLISYQSFEPASVVVGEQLDYRLVVAYLKDGRVRDPRLNPTKKFRDFIQGEIQERKGQKIIDGRPYIINEYIIPLIPLQTGVVTVDDVNVEYKYVKGRKSHSSLFEDDFFSFDNMFSDAFLDVDQKIVFLDPATVEVSALPEAPDNFSGAVGKFIISVKSRDKKVLQGKPLSIDVMISGVGNINAIDRPEFEEGNDYSLSFAGESTEKNEKGTKIGGNRKFEYILIAERPGEIKINPFFLTYFDTEKREYVRTGTESLVIDVEKDPDYTPMISEVGDFTDQSENSFNKKSGERSGSDIQYIMTHTSSSAIISKITLVLITLNILLIIYVILPPVGRKMGSFVISGKERIYRKTVKDLRASFEKGDFYSDFSNIFWKRAGLLLDLPPIKHTGREILDILKKKGMKEELIDRIRRFDEKINFIAFSGSEKSSERQDIDEAVALLSEIRRVS